MYMCHFVHETGDKQWIQCLVMSMDDLCLTLSWSTFLFLLIPAMFSFTKHKLNEKNSRFFETFKDPILTFGSWATFGELSTAIDYHIIITVVCMFVKLLEASVPVLVLS